MPKGSPGRIITFEGGDNTGGNPASYCPELLFGSLEALTRLAAEARSPSSGLAAALDILCATLQWPIGHVYQRAEEAGQTLVSAQLWHLDQAERFAAFQELSQQTSFRAGQGLVGLVLARQRPGLSPDVTRDRRFLRRRAAQAENVHAWLAFPIFADGQVVAVCELFTTERVVFDQSLAGFLTCAGLTLGRLYERECWRAEREQLQQQHAAGEQPCAPPACSTLSALAAAISHEINSPLFSARASLALLDDELATQSLIAGARADLARIAAVMEQLHALARSAPLGPQLASFIDPPAT